MIGRGTGQALATALIVLCTLATTADAETWVQDTWRQTTYYRATFAVPEAITGQLHVTAVDSYEVYLNGVRVTGDSTSVRASASPVSLVTGDNELAMMVVNRGRGTGHGLLAILEFDSLRVVTTTDHSVQPWRWTTTVPVGTAWRTGATTAAEGWFPVQSGVLDTTGVSIPFMAEAEVIAGYAGDVDIGRADGGVSLKGIQGENLALDKPANRIETVDGDLLTAWEPPVASLNFTASVDLQDRFLVSKVRVITKGPDYEANSLRGYSVQVSDDQVRWSEVAALHGITDYERTTVEFTPTWTRFVRIAIVEINAVTQAKVAEIEVFADGFAEEGVYISEPLALDGNRGRKNFGRLDWEATVPARTDLSLQIRAGDQIGDFDDLQTGWSRPLSDGDVWFPATEPGRLMQYRVNMETRDERRTPVFHRLTVDYSTDDLPASAASAWVTPNQAPMGQDTTFVYSIDLSFGAGDLGVERLEILVPSEASLDPAQIEGAQTPLAYWESSQHVLTLQFAEPLNVDTRLRIPLRARTFSNQHSFEAFLYSPGSDNPLNVRQDRTAEPATGSARSWELLATTAGEAVLTRVRPSPRVLTPNGDGINDDTIIEFVLAKVDVPRNVRIQIMDLSGRVVARLTDRKLASGTYLRSANAAGDYGQPGQWDGTNEAGERVPPGLYLYRIDVEADSGDEVRVGVVSVAY